MTLMEKHKQIFKTDKPIIGCVHLAALPFDALVFANEGDRPYLSTVGP